MDNLTHSLVGVVLTDLAMRRRGTPTERRTFVGAGIIAANLPDLDIVYTGITPAPLGYLLHHRGHTHTVLGLAVLAVALGLAYRWLPAVRRLREGDRVRLWGLIAISLASHVVLDAANSYGVHPFHPFDSNWYFGDAVFIFEPWLWLLPGIAVAWNARGRAVRLGAALLVVILLIAAASMAIVPIEAVAALAIVGVPFAWVAHRMSPRARAGAALVASVLIVAGFTGASRLAGREARDALQPHVRGRLVDAILSPNPSSPLCWSVIGVELDEAGGEYVLWRGTLSLVPEWKPPTTCASHRFAGPREVRLIAVGRFALRDETRQPLRPLRDLARRDCSVRAWLRFGRAPVIADGSIYDLRFAERIGQNFSRMRLKPDAESSGCPANVPGWGMPRADLVGMRAEEPQVRRGLRP